MFEAMTYHKDNPRCYRIDVVQKIIKEVIAAETPSPLTDQVIVNSVEKVEDEYDLEVA